MDFSSLTDTQQQQQQQEQQQSYHPSQSHAYEGYYGYQQQQYDASASHQQYYYPYEYATTYPQQQHPAAVPQDSSSTAALHPGPSQPTQHQGVAAPGAPGYGQEDQESYSVPPGLNPAAAAAVAALSQLSQFAGTMDAAERAMAGIQGRQWHGKGAAGTVGQMVAPPQHNYQFPTQHRGMRRGAGARAPYDVGGTRGGGPFRGGRNGGRANLGHHSQGPGTPSFRGRGRGAHRGRGRGRQLHQSSKTSATEPESADTQVSGLAPAVPRQPRLPIAWCDICRVDCNTSEILEQHKAGKRHKKTVQRFKEIQAQQKLLAETQAQAAFQGFNGTMTQPQLVAESQDGVREHPQTVVEVAEENIIVQVGEEIKTSTVAENSQEPFACENSIKNELQGQLVDEQKVSVETEGVIYLPPAEGPRSSRPLKRKMMRFGRGGKRFRYFKPMESRPKVRPREQPRVCTLCSVMCETQVVFDSHIAGKKHISRIKRFQGNAVYGPLDVYIPPNQPSICNPSGPQPLFFGLKTQDMIHLASLDSVMETYGSLQLKQADPADSVLQMEQLGSTQSGEGLGTKYQAPLTVEVKSHSAVTASELETEAEADAAVTTTKNIAVEVEASCKLAEHVTAEAETTFENENAVEAGTYFACKGDDVLEAEAAFTGGDTVAKTGTL